MSLLVGEPVANSMQGVQQVGLFWILFNLAAQMSNIDM